MIWRKDVLDALSARRYDYARPGAYFVTIVTRDRECLFGEVEGGQVRLNALGEIARVEWERAAVVRADVMLDTYVIMPNHIHGIIMLSTVGVGATPRVAPTGETMRPRGPAANSIGAIVGQFKSAVTKRLRALRAAPSGDVWQRNYYEHVIRNEADLARIRAYIQNNPARWTLDELYHKSG